MQSFYVDQLKKELSKCDAFQQVHNTIVNAVKRHGDLVEDEESAEKYFAELGYEGKVKHNMIISQTISLYIELDGDEQGIWAEAKVGVTEHYVDPGSDDYVYSYDVE